MLKERTFVNKGSLFLSHSFLFKSIFNIQIVYSIYGALEIDAYFFKCYNQIAKSMYVV